MSVYDFTVKNNKGKEVSLSEYKGKVLLIVNTATKCGLTPQYEGLEALYEKYHEQGFEILDFPCNQFAFQAPGSAEKIDSFCTLRYNTKFPRFEKIKVNGRDTAPLYVYMKEQKPGRIEWNFAKFLIDREGNVVNRFAPTEKPEKLTSSIEQELARQAG
ncbi:MAG: glutathione peroxidase [Lachnospiraceae bacterium]|nr:glutathione peroxidase [Lachnospiraceae bacterium]